ncbi:MAG TPA: DUF1559 domain-containing protein [Planctomycetaceae bacterium]|jgi:hypothetical protein|nr:DUF1559 domain-containing protein [Planctomycetaceae bacterium]
MRYALPLIGALLLGVSTAAPIRADGSPKDNGDGSPKTNAAGSPTASEDDEAKPLIRVFELRYLQADRAREMLSSLGYGGNYLPDQRTSSLIAQDSKERLDELETLLQAIDRPGRARRPQARNKRGDVSAVDEGESPVPPAAGESPPQSIRALRRAFSQRDAQAARIAATVAGQRQSPGPHPAARELRQQVAAAYEARRQLQLAEVDWLRQRLARIERELTERERIKNQIIDRRVEELLNPGLQWDPSQGEATAVGSAGLNARETIPALAESKEQQTRRNLKELSLAMHNYHDVFHHFPKAVMTARDVGGGGETPHSWRVELLPFVNGGAHLYQEYRMEEPWDSPHNKTILEQMPAVFRSPYDDPKSTNSGYCVLVGPGTPFEKRPLGVAMSEIVDGTSNTILFVEAKRAIPWTKPEDIPFDATKTVPELGGYVEGKFAAAMADGSVHIFERAQVDDILKWMILRNDLHVIKIPAPVVIESASPSSR